MLILTINAKYDIDLILICFIWVHFQVFLNQSGRVCTDMGLNWVHEIMFWIVLSVELEMKSYSQVEIDLEIYNQMVLQNSQKSNDHYVLFICVQTAFF